LKISCGGGREIRGREQEKYLLKPRNARQRWKLFIANLNSPVEFTITPLGCKKRTILLTVRWNSHLVVSNSGGYHNPPPLVDPWSEISGGPMGQLGGSIRPVVPKLLDLPFMSPIRNLAGTPLGQLGGSIRGGYGTFHPPPIDPPYEDSK